MQNDREEVIFYYNVRIKIFQRFAQHMSWNTLEKRDRI